MPEISVDVNADITSTSAPSAAGSGSNTGLAEIRWL